MQLQTINMKIVLVLIFLINLSIDCKPIANVQNSEIEELTSTPSKNNKHMASVVAMNRGNSSRMAMPNDVEWIPTTTKRNQQQVIIPAAESIFELIFAVSFIIFTSFSKCDFSN